MYIGPQLSPLPRAPVVCRKSSGSNQLDCTHVEKNKKEEQSSVNEFSHKNKRINALIGTYGVEALEKVFRSQLAPAVLHVHGPVKLSVFTTCDKKNTTSRLSTIKVCSKN